MPAEDFMANYFDDFPRNVELAEGLDPSVVEQTHKDWLDAATKYADIISSCNDDLLKIHWVSDAADQERDAMAHMTTVAHSQRDSFHSYANENLLPFAQDLGTAKARITPLAMRGLFGSTNDETEREAAQILQGAYGPAGSSRAGELDYQGRASSGDGVSDRGESPSGPSNMSGGSGGHAAASSPQSADDAALLGADAASADQGRSAQNDSGKGSGKGDSLGQGAPGSGSGAPGGSPDSGGPGGGPPPGGLDPSGFGAPADDGLGADSAPNGPDPSGLGGGFVGAGGIGGIGSGEHERSLTQKPSAGGTGKPTINFNAAKPAASGPGVIGGGGMAPGATGRRDGKEHKTADYLKGKEHGRAMLGDELPVVSPEVMGALNTKELKEIERQGKAQEEGEPQNQQAESAPPVPNMPDGPQPRRKSGPQ